MSEGKLLNDAQLADVTGGTAGSNEWKTVCNLQSGYLAIRTAPAADYNNEINHTGLVNGDVVQVTGGTVMGTTFGGGSARYTWVFAPKYGVSGYVNAAYIK